MTGYGRAEETVNGCTITVELRSVNNRYLDCNVRIPRLYLFAEDAIKTRVQSSHFPGKGRRICHAWTAQGADRYTGVGKPPGGRPITAAALRELAELFAACGRSYHVSLRLSRVSLRCCLAEKAEEDVEQMAKDICAVLDRALADFDQMRTREGGRLREDILARAALIEEKVGVVEARSPQTGFRVPDPAGELG